MSDDGQRAAGTPLRRAPHLAGVRYEIRGPLAHRALEIERQGHEVIKLNIGNPAQFGFRMPEVIRDAIIENLPRADGYTHQKGILPAREAIAADARARGVAGVTADDVFMGNGVSELIQMCLEALLEPGEEVLVPAPDYPLWTAAITLTGGHAVHYPCRPENGFVPDPADVERLVTRATRALVIISPNNPTGAVYPPEVIDALVKVAERHRLVIYSDEIYDRIVYDGAEHTPVAPRCQDTLCATFGGLSKVHRACGIRTGWVVFNGRKAEASDYLEGIEVLASLRLCANVPGQWAVPTALGAPSDIVALTADGGRLGRQRRAVLRGVADSTVSRHRRAARCPLCVSGDRSRRDSRRSTIGCSRWTSSKRRGPGGARVELQRRLSQSSPLHVPSGRGHLDRGLRADESIAQRLGCALSQSDD